MQLPTRRYRPSLVFAAAALLAALPGAFAEEPPPGPESRRERRHEMGDRMADELGLNDTQKAQIKALNQKERSELDALRADQSLPKEQRKAKADAIRKNYFDQRQAIFTPEQREKAAKLRERGEKMRDRREDRHGDHDGPPPPPK